MNERRRFPRHTKCLRGRVYFNDGRKSLACLIRDVAYEGARIIIAHQATIPNEIDLYIPKGSGSPMPACDGAMATNWVSCSPK